jgi:DNA-binding response OmpR family regulator
LPRVLVIEDDPDALALLGRVMAMVPADAVPVATVAAARYAVETLDGFDVLLVDRRLPDGDGIALAAELRGRCPPDCRVVIVSGDPAPAPRLPSGIDGWVTKPVDVAALRGLVCLLANLPRGEP